MSAIHWYTRRDCSWSDHPACVSPVIRILAIQFNDICQDGEREALIGPHLFAPVGTATGLKDDQHRAYLCADRAVRLFAPRAVVAAAAAPMAAADAAAATEWAAVAAERAAAGMAVAAAAAAAGAATAAAAIGAISFANAAVVAVGEAIKQDLLQLILDCCAIGDRREVCPVKTREQVLEFCK